MKKKNTSGMVHISEVICKVVDEIAKKAEQFQGVN